MTTKSQAEIETEVKTLRAKLEEYKGEEIRLAELERQLERTLYDLGVHQEELTAQNEELLKTRGKLELLLTKYSILFQDSPVGYFVLNSRLEIIESNLAAATLLNLPKGQLVGKNVLPFMGNAKIAAKNQHFNRVFEHGTATDEFALKPNKGQPVPCILQSQRITDLETDKLVSLTVVFDITERIEAERKIASLAEQNRRILDAAGEGILGIDSDGLIEFANPAVEQLLGWSGPELFGRDPIQFLKPVNADGDAIPLNKTACHLTLQDGEVRRGDGERFHRKDGDGFPVTYVVSPTFDENRISGLVLTFQDVTVRKRAEDALQKAHDELEERVHERTHELWESNQNLVSEVKERKRIEERLQLTAQVFESTGEAIVITNRTNKIVEANSAFTNITGYAQEEALGQDPGFMKSGRHDRAFYAEMWQGIWKKGFWQGEIWDRRKNGEVYPKWLTVNVVKDEQGEIVNCIGVFSDISRVKATEEKLERLAFFDGLTGLPNRTFFKARLEHEFAAASRHEKQVALLFIDLDHFKNVNDTLGHAAGDQLLAEAAERIKGCVREADTVARLGGDEFTVILIDVEGANGVSQVARNILAALKTPFDLEGQKVVVGASIGIGIHPEDGETSDTLIKNADTALYHAKESGRNAAKFFTEELNAKALRRMSLETGLREALENQEFLLHYQPKVEHPSGRIVGLEALVRWLHPEQGLISPGEFIPVAEETGLILEIGERVLDVACRDALFLSEQLTAPVPVSVNLSMRQLAQKNLVDEIQAVLTRSGLPPNLLELEITESMLAADQEETIAKLAVLREMGITISIDDFGTGYSSLSHLKRFPIHTLKIDRSFVMDLPDDPDDRAIAQAVISLANSLGLTVVAEGVETLEQIDFLADHDCHDMQGFFFSRPLPLDELIPLLENPPWKTPN